MEGWDYALVHLKYTIPPALVLTLLFRPFQTRLDLYKIAFLQIVAVTSTVPWDSYLLHRRVWTYPHQSIIGPTLFMIPVEELFFFVVQTYIGSLLYLLLSKPVLGATYLPIPPRLVKGTGLKELHNSTTNLDSVLQPKATDEYERLERIGATGTAFLMAIIGTGVWMVMDGGMWLYMGLIFVWAGPFILFLWSLSYQYIAAVPRTITLLPITITSLYLWLVDSLALSNGTWVIEPDTACGIKLFGVLELEEAVFFVCTNLLVVFGQLAFDHALSIIYAFPATFPEVVTPAPSALFLMKALLLPNHKYEDRVGGVRDAFDRLNAKSRSFSLASGVFEGRLRIDLVLLYSFCRIVDDLVDEAPTMEDARKALDAVDDAIANAYMAANPDAERDIQRELLEASNDHISHAIKSSPATSVARLPAEVLSSISMLPLNYLPLRPLQELLHGFRTDLEFSSLHALKLDTPFPISTESDLETYAYHVAGTVASLLLHLVFRQSSTHIPPQMRLEILYAGETMGKALQYINIARDISKDAEIGRCYIPASWLAEYDITPHSVVQNPNLKKLGPLKKRMLEKAMKLYEENIAAIEKIPGDCGSRKGVRAAVENYVEIGRVLMERVDGEGMEGEKGTATVGKWRRIWVFVNALRQG